MRKKLNIIKIATMTREDPRIQKTKKAFKEAFKELFSEHDDYMEITVTELCATAGLNRRTFYLHYKQVDDVLEEVLEDISLEFFIAVKKENAINDKEKIVSIFFDLNDKNSMRKKMNSFFVYHYLKPTILKKYVEAISKGGIMEKLNSEYNALESLGFPFFYMNLCFAYHLWCQSNRTIPKEEIVKYAGAILEQIALVFEKKPNAQFNEE